MYALWSLFKIPSFIMLGEFPEIKWEKDFQTACHIVETQSIVTEKVIK